MAEFAVQMGQEALEHLSQGWEAYFDGLHLWCIGCKTLALFVYHPAMNHILRIATMMLNQKD